MKLLNRLRAMRNDETDEADHDDFDQKQLASKTVLDLDAIDGELSEHVGDNDLFGHDLYDYDLLDYDLLDFEQIESDLDQHLDTIGVGAATIEDMVRLNSQQDSAEYYFYYK